MLSANSLGASAPAPASVLTSAILYRCVAPLLLLKVLKYLVRDHLLGLAETRTERKKPSISQARQLFPLASGLALLDLVVNPGKAPF